MNFEDAEFFKLQKAKRLQIGKWSSMLASRNPKQTTKLLTKRTSLGQNTRSEGSGECSDPNLFELFI